MVDWVEVPASGRTVLMDLEDWEALQPVLAAGVRLQSLQTPIGARVVLREYDPPRCLTLARLLAGPDVRFLSGNSLDHRRSNLGTNGVATTARGPAKACSSADAEVGRPSPARASHRDGAT